MKSITNSEKCLNNPVQNFGIIGGWSSVSIPHWKQCENAPKFIIKVTLRMVFRIKGDSLNAFPGSKKTPLYDVL
jgi:hypothetical protein